MASSPRRRRVLHVAHNCLPHIGGLETVVAAETRRLAGSGWEVTVVSSTVSGTVNGSGSAGPGVRVEDGVRTVRVPAWHGLERHGVPFPLFSPRLLAVLWREVRRADLVHVHDILYISSWVAALWCVVLRTPYVVHRHVGFVHHSSPVVGLVQRAVVGTVGRFVVGHSEAVLPIDEHVAEDVRSAVPTARVEVLGNGVDTDAFKPMQSSTRREVRSSLGLPLDRPLVLFVGRFVPKKGFHHVAAAASDHYDLVFAGGDRPAGLDDPRLHFVGGLPADRMPQLYGSVDVMVVASVGECPLTVLESMSSGLPLVANDDPALHSPWTAGPGVVFVDVAAGGLPTVLSGLVADRETMRRIGEQGREHVRASYSWDAHLHRVEALYLDVLER